MKFGMVNSGNFLDPAPLNDFILSAKSVWRSTSLMQPDNCTFLQLAGFQECKPHQGQSHKQLHAAVLAFASFCLPIAAGVKDRLFDISVCGKNTKRPIKKQRKIFTVLLLINML